MADRITLSSLSHQYSPDSPRVLTSLSLEIPGGTCCAVLGPTGAGKTSLLHCLAGTMRRHHPETVTSGTIHIGEQFFDGVPADILFPKVGLALQDPHVQISGVRDTVLSEILFTLENIGGIADVSTEHVMELLREMGIERLANRKPTTLSGGETQRVALATILIAKPPVLLLDEPATALDLAAQEKLRGILKAMHGSITVVLTDTQLDFSLGICDQIVLMNSGNIEFDGGLSDFLGNLDKFKDLLPLEDWANMEAELKNLAVGSTPEKARLRKALGIR